MRCEGADDVAFAMGNASNGASAGKPAPDRKILFCGENA